MAAKKLLAVLCIVLAFLPIHAAAQQVSTATTSTSSISVEVLDRIFEKHGLQVPSFCDDMSQSKKYCAIAPLLYESGLTWETRAHEQFNRAERLQLDVTSCELRCLGAQKPTPPIEIKTELGLSVKWVLVGVGGAIVLVLAGIGMGFALDDD